VGRGGGYLIAYDILIYIYSPPRTEILEKQVEGNGNGVNLMESAHISYRNKFYSFPRQINTPAFLRSL